MRRSVLLLACLTCASEAQDLRHLVEAPGNPYRNLGHFAVPVPDHDGDGVQDLAFIRAGSPPGGPQNQGQIVVFSTATSEALAVWSSPAPQEGGDFGRAAARFTGPSGRLEIAVGAPGEAGTDPFFSGRVYVLDAATGAVRLTLQAHAGTLVGSFGSSVAALGDLTGDGVADLAIGAPSEAVGEIGFAGRIHLHDGATGAWIRTIVPEVARGGGAYGRSLLAVGDADGDGLPDLAVSDPGAPIGLEANGIVTLHSGATGAVLYGLTQPILDARRGFGSAIALAGDIDGDGTDDLVVGAPRGDVAPDPAQAGVVYAYSLRTGALLDEWRSPVSQAGSAFGSRLARVADLDGDGHADLLAGGGLERIPADAAPARTVHVLSGRTGAPIASLKSRHIPPFGPPDHSFGFGFGDAGDLDGDGSREILIAATGEWIEPGRTGRLYVFGAFPTSAAARPPASELRLRVAPNPLSTRGTLTVALRESGRLRLGVYDLLGREVAVLADGPRAAGEHTVELDASGWAPGVYLVRLATGDDVQTTRLTVAR